MSRFASLLLPLDGSPEAAKGANCALWLAERLGATLHVLHASVQPLPVRDALARLHVPDARQPRVVLHQLHENADTAVLEAVAAYGVDLVIMSARGESASAGIKLSACLGSVAQAVIERSVVPVLLLPIRYKEVLPWTSMLAAASGETAADYALEAATQLAAAIQLKVTVVHAETAGTARTLPMLGDYIDEPHHEYPPRMEGMVERGLAGCTAEECCSVEQALLRRGDPASVLLDQAARHGSSVLALGWHGTLSAGRALVLKQLMEEAESALLLVRKVEESRARLKIGADIEG